MGRAPRSGWEKSIDPGTSGIELGEVTVVCLFM